MATRSTAGQRIAVRATRRGHDLRIEGTFASSYRRGPAITGSLWDGLAAPLAALAPEGVRRVLVLGLGGGSAARALRALAPRAEIVGVESDARVIAAARRFLALD